MGSVDERLRKSRSSPFSASPDGGKAEAPPSLHAASISPHMSLRLRKGDQYQSSSHTAKSKNGSGEKSEYPSAKAPGHPPMKPQILSPPLGQFVINLLLQLAGIVAAIAFGIFAVESLDVAKQATIEARVANQLAMLTICTQNNSVPAFCSRVLANENLVFPNEATSLFTAVPTSTPDQTITSSTSKIPTSTITASMSASTSSTAASLPTHDTTSTPAYSVGTPEPSGTTSGSPSPSASSRLSNNVIIGIAVPAVCILLVLFIAVTVICIRRRRYRGSSDSGEPETMTPENHAVEPPSEGPYSDDTPGKESELTGPIPPARGLERWWKVFRALFLESTITTR